MSVELSSSLYALVKELGALDTDEGLPFHKLSNLHSRLSLCADLAQAMETELTAFRIIEGNRQGRAFMEAEAAKALNKPIVSHDGKVVHPDFGRKA